MKRVFSGIQPTSNSLHLGNYLGAITNWIELQNKYECYYSIVDLHSLTTNPNPEILRKNVYLTAAQLLASGINPNKSTLFVQSDVIEHSSLTWYLSSKTNYGELKRMTQFKDKSKNENNIKNISAGLFTYPILMASDILLYNTDFVPVGIDQKQHLELTIQITKRLNTLLKKSEKSITIPQPLISKYPKIRDLQEPKIKMSKSTESPNGVVNLLDDNKILEKKIKSAVTDSLNKITYTPKKQPGLANLINIFSGLTEQTPKQIVKKYENKMYGHLKIDLAKIIIDKFSKIRNKTNELLNDKKYLNNILNDGANQAQKVAKKNYLLITSQMLGNADKIKLK